MNVISHRYIYLVISGILVAGSIIAIVLYGLPLGTDFTGGSLWEVEFRDAPPPAEKVEAVFKRAALDSVTIQKTGEQGMIFRFSPVDEAMHQKLLWELTQAAGARAEYASSSATSAVAVLMEKRFDTVGPVIGAELRQRAITAILVAMGAIILYIAWAFRGVSRPVSSWKYGVAAVIALCHDVIIPTGVFAVLGAFGSAEINALFITALLTIMGFSVHDTIVVFDRTRENLAASPATARFRDVVQKSINETMVRSLNTSLTVILVLFVLLFLGGEATRYFVLALIIGIMNGTYSSIFVASMLLVVWHESRFGMREGK
ncbi:MAG: protein translocase subunit SecF [Patescibacteria group bacterium]